MSHDTRYLAQALSPLSSSSYGYRVTVISPVFLSAIYPRLIPGCVARRECYHQLYANHWISPHNVPCKLVYGCLTSYRKRWLDIVSVLSLGIDISCTSSDVTFSKALPCAAVAVAASALAATTSGLYRVLEFSLQCGWPQTRSRIALSAMSYCAELIVFSTRGCHMGCLSASV